MFIKQVTPDQLVIGAPAKINLFLEVLNRRIQVLDQAASSQTGGGAPPE